MGPGRREVIGIAPQASQRIRDGFSFCLRRSFLNKFEPN